MKQFAVAYPASLIIDPVMGKVTRKVPGTLASEYTIRLLGLYSPYFLCSEIHASKRSRVFLYTADPSLHVGDVLEFSKGTCYVHFSAASNDNCLIIANECNENCVNCPQLARTKNPGVSARNAQLIKLLPKHTQKMALTGGEPTVDFPALLHCIRDLTRRNPSIHLDILTNGIVLADISKVEELATMLKQQTSTFCITLYGDIPSIHDAHTRTPGSFAKVNAALHHLAFHGYTIELRYLITKMNYNRLPAFIEYAYDNFPFVDHISLMGMEFSGDAVCKGDQLYVATDTYSTFLVAAVQKAVMRDIPIFIYNHQVCLLPKQLWRFAVASISDWKTGYSELCQHCDVKGYCGGFFTTSDPLYIPSQVFPIHLDYDDKEALCDQSRCV